ncbi:MAG: tryptophan--tRNA ligase [Actinomycetota bacterium]
MRDPSGQRVFSGIQPTGVPHLGNYLGAMRNWVALQDDHDAFFCVVDLHALTLPWDPQTLRDQTLEVGASLLACGVDPERSVLFVQSQVPAHAELAWVLSCVARIGELRRMVQFKEKSKGAAESIGVGLFTYPVLQAADVLLYRAHGVPVGEDQRQHIELMRDLATRFNATFGDVFVVPEPWISPLGARIMALDDPTQKMSKSAARPASSISLTDGPDAIARKIRSAVTDSGREIRVGDDKPALTNLLTIYSLVTDQSFESIETRWSGSGYGEFKRALGDALIERLEPIRRRLEQYTSDPSATARVLDLGAARAAQWAADTMSSVRAAVGLGDASAPEGAFAQSRRRPFAAG